MILRGPQPLEGPLQDVGNSTTLIGYAKARGGRCQWMTRERLVHNTTPEFDVVRSRYSNFIVSD